MKAGFGLRGLSRWLEGGRREVPAFVPPAPGQLPRADFSPAADPQTEAPFAMQAGFQPGEPPHAPAPPPPAPETDGRDALMAAFNPAHPVQRRRDLCGRDDKLAALFDAMLNQAKHAIVHGARGSGKTSLVHVFGDYADQRGAIVIYMACEDGISFGELIRHYARFVPSTDLSAERRAAFAEGVAALDDTSRPRAFVELFSVLGDTQVIFILDEFDRVSDAKVKGDVATFMKLLSDAHAPVQLLIVGIASSVADIIDCHPSLRRHMTAIAVGRIAREDVGLLVDQGAARAGLRFDHDARELIVRTSCGSPYHARVFAYAAGLDAIRRGRQSVDQAAALAGLAAATEQWARLNEADSQLFRNLAAQPAAMRNRLADIARVAAIGDGFTRGSVIEDGGADVQMEGALEGALVSDVRDIGRKIFRDSLAPQFLLAGIELAAAEEAQRRAPPPPPPPAPPVPQSYAPPQPTIDWERYAAPTAPPPAYRAPPPQPAQQAWQSAPPAPPQPWERTPPAPVQQPWQGAPPPAPQAQPQWFAPQPAAPPVFETARPVVPPAPPAPPTPPQQWPGTEPLPSFSWTAAAEPPTYPTEPYKPYTPPAASPPWDAPPRSWR